MSTRTDTLWRFIQRGLLSTRGHTFRQLKPAGRDTNRAGKRQVTEPGVHEQLQLPDDMIYESTLALQVWIACWSYLLKLTVVYHVCAFGRTRETLKKTKQWRPKSRRACSGKLLIRLLAADPLVSPTNVHLQPSERDYATVWGERTPLDVCSLAYGATL